MATVWTIRCCSEQLVKELWTLKQHKSTRTFEVQSFVEINHLNIACRGKRLSVTRQENFTFWVLQKFEMPYKPKKKNNNNLTYSLMQYEADFYVFFNLEVRSIFFLVLPPILLSCKSIYVAILLCGSYFIKQSWCFDDKTFFRYTLKILQLTFSVIFCFSSVITCNK